MSHTVNDDPSAIFLSVSSEYARKIIAGEKTVELRRKFSSFENVFIKTLIYSSKIDKAIIGECIVDEAFTLPIEDIWKNFGTRAAISAIDFERYFFGREQGHVLQIKKAAKFNKPVTLYELQNTWRFTVPQSYRYVSNTFYRSIISASE